MNELLNSSGILFIEMTYVNLHLLKFSDKWNLIWYPPDAGSDNFEK